MDTILNQFHPSPIITNCSLRSILMLPTHLIWKGGGEEMQKKDHNLTEIENFED